MKKTLLLLSSMATVLLLSALSLSAQEEPQAPPLPIDPAVRIGKLPNGLTYYIRHNEQPKDRAHFWIAQRVGSMQEEDHQSGLAHFLEHMAFNGTKNFPGKGIINLLEKNGVKFGSNLNAYTSFDETVYQIMDAPTTRESFVDSCLLILHDWSNSLLLTDEEIDNERGVINEEWRQSENGQTRALIRILKEAFPEGHNYGKRLPIGTMDVVMNFPYQTLRDYYHKWYRPDLQGLIIVGDVDVDRIEKKIKEMFAHIKLDEKVAERVYHEVPDHDEPISIIATDPELTSTTISIMVHSDALDRETRATAVGPMVDYIKNVISSMMSYRFAEIQQQPNAPFRSASLSMSPYIVAATEDALTLDVSAFDGEYLKGMNAAVGELKRAWEYGFTQSEYDRVRTEVLASYDNMLKEKDNRTNEAYAKEYAQHFTTGGYIPGIETEVAIMNQIVPNISLEMINKTLKDMFHYPEMKNFTMFLMAPEKDGLKYPTSAELLSQFKSAMEQKVEPYAEEISDEKLMDQLPKGGQVASEQKDMAYGATLWTLTNGIKVYILPTDHNKNEVSVYGISPGGTSKLDFAKDPITARALSYAGVGGISRFAPIALSKVLSGRKASCNTSIDEFGEHINGNSSIKDMETMFQLIYLNMTDIREDQDLFTAAIQRSNASIESSMVNPMFTVSRDSIPNLIYPNTPQRRALKIEENNQINYQKVLAAYRDRFADAGEFTFFIIGDFKPAELKPLVAQYLGALPNTGRNEKADYDKAIHIAQKSRTTHFDLPMANPMAFVLDVYAWQGAYDLRTSMIANILSAVLDQQYLISIREEEGGTYGVGTEANVSHHPKGESSLVISFQTNPNDAKRLNDRVKAELQEMAKNGINEEFFKKTILNMEKNFEENQRENNYWLGALVDKYYWGEDNHTNYLKTLRSITPKDVQAMLQQILKDSRYLELIASGVEKK